MPLFLMRDPAYASRRRSRRAAQRPAFVPLLGVGLLPLLATPGRAQLVPTTPAPPASSPATPTPLVSARPIAKGVRLLQTAFPDGTPGGALLITTVEVDTKAAKGVRVESALGQDQVWGTDSSLGRETVSSITGRHKAVAGINACFFPFTGVPLGLHVQNGEMVTEPDRPRTVFWIGKDGATHFDMLSSRGSVQAAGATMPLDGMNRPAPTEAELAKTPDKDPLLLYTPIFFPNTLPRPGRFEVALQLEKKDWPLPSNRDVTAKVIGTHEGGGMKLAPGTVILSGGGAGADFLRKLTASADASATIHVDLQTEGGQPFDLGSVRSAVTGGPRLLTDGRITVRNREEGLGDSFSTTQHPRSAVGVMGNGKIVLVTVDGRQKGISRGISLTELAQRMQAMGCVDALNLDGGGSSCLSVGGAVVNSPSEGLERPDATMLLVYAPPLDGKPQIPSALTSAPKTLQSGDTLPLFTGAAAPRGVVWGTRGGIGYITQADGVFHAHAARTRTGELEWVVPGSNKPPTVALRVQVAAAATGDQAGFVVKMTLTPDPADANKATLTLHIANAEGDPLSNEAVTLAVVGGKADPATVTTDGKGNAQTSITWDGTTPSASRTITATSSTDRFPATTVHS